MLEKEADGTKLRQMDRYYGHSSQPQMNQCERVWGNVEKTNEMFKAVWEYLRQQCCNLNVQTLGVWVFTFSAWSSNIHLLPSIS